MSTATKGPAAPAAGHERKRSKTVKRGIMGGVIVMLLGGVVLGTEVVDNDAPVLLSAQAFNAETFGDENFANVQEGIVDRAVEATTLASAITTDLDAAIEEYAVASSGGPVFSVTFTGVVGEGQSGIYPIVVEGLPEDLLVRIQTGPAINGTELRDATGEIGFGQFKNQIDYQDAGAALNEQLKESVLAGIDTVNLQGKTVTVTGAFTLVNPEAWLVTPVKMEVE